MTMPREAQDLQHAGATENHAVYRAVNEQLLSLNQAFDELVENALFVCECARLDCIAAVEMTLADYAAVRADPRRFVVAPTEDHVVPEVERVVGEAPGYYVVETVGLVPLSARA